MRSCGRGILRSVHYRDQENVNFQLKERLRLVQSWKCDLQQELNYNKKESACLEEKIRQLEHALKETYRPLQTALDCQKHRLDVIMKSIKIHLWHPIMMVSTTTNPYILSGQAMTLYHFFSFHSCMIQLKYIRTSALSKDWDQFADVIFKEFPPSMFYKLLLLGREGRG